MTTRIAQMLRIIADKPGIRSVELADLISIDADLVRPTLKTHIEKGEVRFEKIQAPNGRWINAYYIGDGSAKPAPPVESFDGIDIDGPKQRTISWPPKEKKTTNAKSAAKKPAVSANTVGCKLIRIDDDETLDIGIFSTGELFIKGRGTDLRLTIEETKNLHKCMAPLSRGWNSRAYGSQV